MKKLVSAIICLTTLSILPCQGEPIVAVTSNNLLLFFDSATPGTLTRNIAVTGLTGGETIIGMDYRRSNGRLYAVTTNSRLYTLNETTGAATPIGSAGGFTLSSISGNIIGLNFDPVLDRLRLVTGNQNIRINPDTGAVSNFDQPGRYVGGDPHDANFGAGTPIAYTNTFLGAQNTVCYGIDSAFDNLLTWESASAGNLHTIGILGVNVNTGPRMGFDISGTTGFAYACLSIGNVPTFYTITLGNGLATSVGRVSTAAFLGSLTINALTVPTPTRVLNLATRGFVSQGDSVLIGGFIAQGAATSELVVRGIGPSLSSFFSNALANPRLEIFDANGISVKSNDDWKNGPQVDMVRLIQVGLQPTNDLEAATVVTLPPGQYTAVISSIDPNEGGVALVEIYQL
jgi:hypothetical protein